MYHTDKNPGEKVTNMMKMKTTCSVSALCLYLSILTLKVVAGDVCVSNQFTHSGECCSLCSVGTGVASGCGQENTKCQPCQEGVTFSDLEDLSLCRPCARCPPGVPQLARCTAARDTRCDCGPGFFLWRDGNSSQGLCAPCSVCRRGEGVVRPCGSPGDTVCQICPSGTYSEERSASKPCTPCLRCGQSEVEIRPCQANSDTLCMDKELHIQSRPVGSEGPWDFPRRSAPLDEESVNKSSSTSSGSDAGPPPTPHEQGGNNIVVYVSVLAAVVLGLLLYVAYKCWKSFQQKKALGKARAGELNNVAEGEKLHSDSGVFLDSHSLQDTQPSKGSKRDSKQDARLYVNLPPHRQEEVEQLLAEGSASCSSRGWRQLAAALGYEQERVDMFGRGEDPVHTLLSDWAQHEGSTLGVLCSALSRIERLDVASVLTAPAQGVSVV